MSVVFQVVVRVVKDGKVAAEASGEIEPQGMDNGLPQGMSPLSLLSQSDREIQTQMFSPTLGKLGQVAQTVAMDAIMGLMVKAPKIRVNLPPEFDLSDESLEDE